MYERETHLRSELIGPKGRLPRLKDATASQNQWGDGALGPQYVTNAQFERKRAATETWKEPITKTFVYRRAHAVDRPLSRHLYEQLVDCYEWPEADSILWKLCASGSAERKSVQPID